MELNYLRYFYEVAKAGSFTEAARRLHISQSALSKAVAMLEDQEGVKLLSRSKRGVALTPVGSEIFMKSERLFALAAEIEATCKGTSEVCEGPLSFGASDHVVNYLLLPVLQRMRTDYPKVLPRVSAGTPNDIVERILANESEFGLFFTRINIPSIRYEPLVTVPMAVICHPGLVETGELSSARVKKLFEANGFIGSIRTQYQVHPSSGLMAMMPKDPLLALESNSQETQKRFCLMGGGIAYLARFMVEDELAKGKLIEIPVKKPNEVQLYLATRKGRELPITARTFLSLLRSSLGAA